MGNEKQSYSLQDAVEKTRKDHAEERYTQWLMSHGGNSNQYDKDLINWLYNCILSFDE